MTRWIVEERYRDPAPDRYYAGYKPNIIKPVEAVIYHYTASTKPGATRRWLTMDDEVFVSSHFIVERSGVVWQLVPLDERAAHAGGRSSKLFGQGNVNGRTIGIEIMNVGPLVPRGDDYFTLSGKRFDGAMVCAGGKHPGRDADYEHTVWEAYSPMQLDAVADLTKKLCQEFPILTQGHEDRLTGHENVDPTRKTDPGPAFPWKLMYDAAEEVAQEAAG
jgi:N-acetyl-anhydromuramyl-L-alanine amidase AmpD